MSAERINTIVNAGIVTPEGLIEHGAVTIVDGRITSILPEYHPDTIDDQLTLDAQGLTAVPGFIDLHAHGLHGHNAMGTGLAGVIRALPTYGVTSFTATTLTLPYDETLRRLTEMAVVIENPPEGANCAGIHLEGPFLSPARPGMASAAWFESLSWQRFSALQNASGGRIRLVSFAPELGGAMECIPQLIASGVIPSIGHSDATFDQVAAAVKLGLSHATHTFNAMRPLHHREPGVVGAVLYFDEITAQLIADGIHIHPAVMAVLLRTKGLRHVALVSDAAPLAGMPDGIYKWDDSQVFVQGGACRLADGTIAGSHALLDTGVRNLVRSVGLSLEEALIPASRVPADLLGLRKGRLSPGYDADIVLLDADLHPAVTIVGGKVAFSRGDTERVESVPTSTVRSPTRRTQEERG
ncbi:MAG: N-acetylglucosamine-6-phosphate deacetylase [Chloroflexi bacterium]|nr:N-acetylglucosamine-6-phosphate deacetylase [Chloroflexota bacterium]